jgi:hypothetical protein
VDDDAAQKVCEQGSLVVIKRGEVAHLRLVRDPVQLSQQGLRRIIQSDDLASTVSRVAVAPQKTGELEIVEIPDKVTAVQS